MPFKAPSEYDSLQWTVIRLRLLIHNTYTIRRWKSQDGDKNGIPTEVKAFTRDRATITQHHKHEFIHAYFVFSDDHTTHQTSTEDGIAKWRKWWMPIRCIHTICERKLMCIWFFRLPVQSLKFCTMFRSSGIMKKNSTRTISKAYIVNIEVKLKKEMKVNVKYKMRPQNIWIRKVVCFKCKFY